MSLWCIRVAHWRLGVWHVSRSRVDFTWFWSERSAVVGCWYNVCLSLTLNILFYFFLFWIKQPSIPQGKKKNCLSIASCIYVITSVPQLCPDWLYFSEANPPAIWTLNSGQSGYTTFNWGGYNTRRKVSDCYTKFGWCMINSTRKYSIIRVVAFSPFCMTNYRFAFWGKTFSKRWAGPMR